MELSEICSELEALLDCGCLDEGWSNWLRECADTAQRLTGCEERLRLLRAIQDCEAELSQLRPYLLERGQSGERPQQRLTYLLHALDSVARRELGEQATAEPASGGSEPDLRKAH